MAFKTATGAITIGVSLTGAGNYTITPADANTCSHYLVIGISCLDSNGQRRKLDCKTDGYTNYIVGVSGAEAVNGHAALVNLMCPIDETNMLATGAAYNFGRLSGILGSSTQVFLSVMCYV